MPTVKVVIIESEKGWGQRIDEVREFKGETLAEAKEKANAFIKEFNSKNTEKEVPDWYMYARLA